MGAEQDRAELVSWKEIASYLRIHVRHRAGLGARPRLARAPTSWRAGSCPRVHTRIGFLKTSHPEPTPAVPLLPLEADIPHTVGQVRPARWRYVIGAVAIIFLIAGGAWARFHRTPVPSSFRVDEYTLMVSGADGELWRRRFPEGIAGGSLSADHALPSPPNPGLRIQRGPAGHALCRPAQRLWRVRRCTALMRRVASNGVLSPAKAIETVVGSDSSTSTGLPRSRSDASARTVVWGLS